MPDASWIVSGSGGKPIMHANFVSIADECCCGCCPDVLRISNPAGTSGPVQGTILEAELIEDTTGCFNVGATMEMRDNFSPNIWTSQAGGGVGFFGNAGWRGLTVSCGTDGDGNDVLNMIFDFTGTCPLIDHSSVPGTFIWDRLAGECIPFKFIFSYRIDERSTTDPPTPGCECDGSSTMTTTVNGVVTVRVTIKVP